jgi:octaprenyl-diphosphate synthase
MLSTGNGPHAMNATQLNGKSAAPAVLPFGLIADDLAAVEQILSRRLAVYRPKFAPLIDHLKHYRGKRLRPSLLLLTARACGQVSDAHHVLAAAIELIHTATLVHDDVLDEADLRRHVPTVNSAWGNRISILLGDLLFTNAYHLTSTLGDARACEWIGAAADRVCAGELGQLTEAGNLSLSAEDYFAIIEGKTGALTECACRLGAIYAGASQETAEGMATFGRDLGLAFQIADDLLDLVGDERKVGKTLGTDLKQQKCTLPLIYLFERLPEAECIRLQRLLRDSPAAGHAEVVAALKASDATARARSDAERLAAQAGRALRMLSPSPYADLLRQMTGWAVSRDR